MVYFWHGLDITFTELVLRRNKMSDITDDYMDNDDNEWMQDIWTEEDWADFLGCEVEELEVTMENQMD